MADSFQCMTKPTTIKKIKKRERNYGVCSNPVKKKKLYRRITVCFTLAAASSLLSNVK